MKTLLILRHAKSSWPEPGLDDHDRPLNDRGRRDAPCMGRLLVAEDLVPDCVLSSTALRARTTAEAVVEATRFEGQVALLPALYLDGPRAVLRALAALPEPIARPLLVGHNPDLEQVVAQLSGEDVTLPTAALAVIQLPIAAWSELGASSRGKLCRLITPKSLPT